MFGIGETELVLILVFAFLVFGPERLPGIGRTVGRALRQFRNAQEGFTQVVQTEIVDPATEAMSDAPKRPNRNRAQEFEEDSDIDEATGDEAPRAKRSETFAERKARLEAERKAARDAEEAAAAAAVAAAATTTEDPDADASPPEGPAADGPAGAAAEGPAKPTEARTRAARPTPAAPTSAADLYAMAPRRSSRVAEEPEPEAETPEPEPAAGDAPAPEAIPADEDAQTPEDTAKEDGSEQA